MIDELGDISKSDSIVTTRRQDCSRKVLICATLLHFLISYCTAQKGTIVSLFLIPPSVGMVSSFLSSIQSPELHRTSEVLSRNSASRSHVRSHVCQFGHVALVTNNLSSGKSCGQQRRISPCQIGSTLGCSSIPVELFWKMTARRCVVLDASDKSISPAFQTRYDTLELCGRGFISLTSRYFGGRRIVFKKGKRCVCNSD